ncbi:variant-specific surface protein [Plasmodium falciparum RAJ116]|uniref:Variant-specific surface protein n=2 Tax=Plasmodium falciparum TaxID=5833 RepID=A0A0L0CTS4_PLAFA|nr:variant-specific surface protein [Plasmodium falciparum RAJ116]
MVTQNGGGGSGEDDKDAKHVLDEFGQQVYKEVKNDADAKKYIEALRGDLKKAASSHSELNYTTDTCKLVEDYYNKHVNGVAARGERYPCKELSGIYVERFSDKIGGQCTREKISGSTSTCGACAPYRRLHLCSHNLETIDTKSTTSDTLLLEVCMAAKYEGQSITGYYPIYQTKYNDYGSPICTVLARSFADIGDIVRGKDLFLGNDKEKDQRKKLEKNLKTIFGNIYKELKKDRKNGEEELQKRYKKDEDKNFFKLREDWWEENRQQVWKALTCDAHGTYFRATCGDEEKKSTLAKNNCRCKKEDGKSETDQVPTYFDYVPQYLRWFEEWAEDFCRLRKRKLKDAKEQCRGPSGKDKYCDLNRYDCEKTIRGDHDFVEKDDCKGCQYSCSRFVNWIDNQKLEFLKQKEKYEKEITGGSCSKKRSARGSDHDGYEKKFYKELKGTKYKDVNNFLQKLNDEEVCKKKLNNDDEEEGTINFKHVKSSSAADGGDSNNKTFYRTTYCEACPWCGAERKSDGGKGWKDKDHKGCDPGKKYADYKNTQIPILTGDKTKGDMVQKYNKFCNGNGGNGATGATPTANGGDNSDNATTGYCGGTNSDKDPSLCEKWTCYYYKKKENNDGKKAINFCVLQDGNENTKDRKDKSYNAFFWDWVHDMLIHSIKWRNELGSCINNAKSQNCKNNKCNRECGCFAKWIDKKKNEWEKIVEHFNTQDFGTQGEILGPLMNCPDFVLKTVLEKNLLLEIIEGTYGKSKETEHIKALLEKEEATGGIDGAGFLALLRGDPGTTGCGVKGANGQNSIIDKLLKHEEEIAKTCIEKHTCPPPAPAGGPGARSLPSPKPPGEDPGSYSEGEADDDEDDEDEEGEEQPPAEEEGEGPQETQLPDACNIVKTLFESTKNFEDACKQKYALPQRYWGWKCIPTEKTNAATSDEGGDRAGPSRSKRGAEPTRDSAVTTTTSSDNKGAICIPPRRRRLYVGKLTQWASQVPQGDASSTSSQNATQLLRDAFIKSAAIETFFLWDRYKKIKEKEKQEKKDAKGQIYESGGKDDENKNKDPQTELNDGTIPEEFKRQMFYTLGDYRDICIGKTPHGIDTVSGKETDMQKIKETIDKVFPNSVSTPPTPPGPQKSENPRDTWWKTNGEHIWKGMVCALTYKENEKDKKIKKDDEVYNKFFGTQNGKPGTTGTYKDKYDYNTVKLDDTSGAKSNDNPTLEEFSKRPTFFRWLEEWGEEFCRKRTHKLYIIEKDCKVDDSGNRGCSGDGLECTDPVPDKKDIFRYFNCSTCARHCRFYRKWIERKKYEFTEQQKAYDQQKGDAKNNSGATYDQKFVTELEKYGSIDSFLDMLKNGPCKKNSEEEGKKGGDILDFSQPEKTFKHTKHCDPCSEFKVDCKNCNGGDTKGKCNRKNTIDATEIENIKTNTKEVTMLVSDGNKKFFDGLNKCEFAGIFEGIRKDEWKCRNVCGVDICTLEKTNTNAAEKWVEEKRKEWQKINSTYQEINENKNDHAGNNLSTFLQQAPFKNEVDKAIKPCPNLDKFEKSKECAVDANSENGHTNKKDIVECLLDKLEKKATSCQTNHKPSAEPCTQTTSKTPSLDDEDLFLEENENQVKPPEICPKPPEPERELDEGKCEEATAPPKEPAQTADGGEGKQNPEQTPILKPEEGTPSNEEQPVPEPPQEQPVPEPPQEQPKKTKSSVGNLFQILQIPKGDYDIPTLKSSNRYIPYVSDRYKGKTYIYMEGDSSGDEKYAFMSDTTDVTSSESEYEELDINDIYVPGSPKYKTLIEVVLEPSKRDIQSDNTPMNKFTDDEWNQLKHDFISNMLQNQPNDVPNDYKSGDIPSNTQPNTLYFNKPEEKPFITSIHDRNLYTGEEYNYNVNMVNNDDIPINRDNNVYSGIDLINDSLNSNNVDIYDELLKRKENELFGTNHPKHTNTHNVTKSSNSDPIDNQLDLFHTWLDRHRDMCEQWNNKEKVLDKLKEEWNKDNNSGDIPIDSNKTLNTDVSIQIHMDNPKPKNEFKNMDTTPNKSTMDTMLDDLEKYNEPYYYDFYKNDIYYDVNDDDKTSMDNNNNLVDKNNPVDNNNSTYNHRNPADINKNFVHKNNQNQHPIEKPTKIQIEMNSNNREVVEQQYPIADIWNI